MNSEIKLKQILEKVGIKQQVIDNWLLSFNHLKPEEIELFIDYMAELPAEEVRFFSELLEQKIGALKSSNKLEWQALLEKESNYFENVI